MEEYLGNLQAKCQRYASLYYRQARYWRYCHFLGGAAVIIISGVSGVIVETVDPRLAAYKPLVSSFNFLVSAIGAVLTFSKPLQRVTINEHGGDKYQLLCDRIDIDTLKHVEPEAILNMAYAKWSKYIKEMDEPDLSDDAASHGCCCV